LLYAKAGLFLSKSLILASLKQFSDAKTARPYVKKNKSKNRLLWGKSEAIFLILGQIPG